MAVNRGKVMLEGVAEGLTEVVMSGVLTEEEKEVLTQVAGSIAVAMSGLDRLIEGSLPPGLFRETVRWEELRRIGDSVMVLAGEPGGKYFKLAIASGGLVRELELFSGGGDEPLVCYVERLPPGTAVGRVWRGYENAQMEGPVVMVLETTAGVYEVRRG